MVNFRYHLVSLTAVFLALAVGIIVGVTVVDNGLVDQLKGRLDGVRADVRVSEATNDALRKDLADWASFADKGGAGLVNGHLRDVPVVIVATRGIPERPIKDLRDALISADARVLTTLWITTRFALTKSEDQTVLAGIVGPAPSADGLRQRGLAAIATELVGQAPTESTTTTTPTRAGQPSNPGGPAATTPKPDSTSTTIAVATGATLTSVGPPAPSAAEASATASRFTRSTPQIAALVAAGFLAVDAPSGVTFDASQPLPAGVRLVVAGGAGANLSDVDAAIPLVRAASVASQAARPDAALRVVAVESGRPAQGRDPEVRGAFVSALRASDHDLDTRVSSCNAIEDFRGRVATILAIADLDAGRTGHYGFGAGADRLVPDRG